MNLAVGTEVASQGHENRRTIRVEGATGAGNIALAIGSPHETGWSKCGHIVLSTAEATELIDQLAKAAKD